MPPRHHRPAQHGPGRRFSGGRNVYFEGAPSELVSDTILVTPSDLDLILVPPTDEPEFKTPGAGRFEHLLETYVPNAGHLEHLLETYTPNAGDLLPTGGAAVRNALDQENANWVNLNDAVIASLASGKIGTDFSFPFTTDLFAWKTFYTLIMQNTPFGWEPMSQLDEWRKKRANWAAELERKIGIKLPGNLNQAPPREAAPVPTSGDSLKLVAAIGAIAAIVVFGPTLMRHLS